MSSRSLVCQSSSSFSMVDWQTFLLLPRGLFRARVEKRRKERSPVEGALHPFFKRVFLRARDVNVGDPQKRTQGQGTIANFRIQSSLFLGCPTKKRKEGTCRANPWKGKKTNDWLPILESHACYWEPISGQSHAALLFFFFTLWEPHGSFLSG